MRASDALIEFGIRHISWSLEAGYHIGAGIPPLTSFIFINAPNLPAWWDLPLSTNERDVTGETARISLLHPNCLSQAAYRHR